MKYQIAGLNIELDMDSQWIHERFREFERPGFLEEDISIQIRPCEPIWKEEEWEKIEYPPSFTTIFKRDQEWILLWPNPKDIISAIESKKGWRHIVLDVSEKNMKDAYKKFQKDAENRMRSFFFQSIGQVFRFAVVPFHSIYVHGVLIEYQGRGIGFSASSGTGKSTHTNLWKQKYPIRILNGDNFVLRLEGESLYAYSLPWCGSSGIFKNTRILYHGTVFLNQDTVNRAKELEPMEACLNYLSEAFLPRWDQMAMEKAMDTIGGIVSKTCDFQLGCRPEPEAVEVIKKCVDKTMW